MKRALAVLAVLAMLVVPAVLTVPRAVEAQAQSITIHTKELGSLKPALYACYTLTDLNLGEPNGGSGKNCDNGQNGDAEADGMVVVTLLRECSPCRVTQSLPEKPDSTPPDYLLEDPQITEPGGTLTFKNYLKPYIVVTMIDAKTGKPFKGACVSVSRPGVGGTEVGGCDGNPGGGTADQDLRKNGKLRTKRLSTPSGDPVTLTYRVVGNTPGYKARAITVSAEPATTGESEKVTLKFRRIN